MITLDTGLLIAHFYPQDPHHMAATEFLTATATDGFLIHSLNMAEVLVGGIKVGRAQEMLSDLSAIGVTVADRLDGEPLRLAKLWVTAKLKLPDCCALDTAMTSASPLATFDNTLAKAAKHHHVTVLPTEVS
jgi:predicted nucleic acid-binding protein